MQVLVIARVTAGTPPIEEVMPLVQAEAAKVWEFYAAEMIRSIYYIADMSGAVMIWELPSFEDVETELQKLPMVQTGLLEYEAIPLKPYTGLAELFAN